MRIVLPIVFLFASVLALAQDRSTYKWYFGEKQGLDFSTSPPTVLTDGQSVHREGSSVVSDALSGELLFYTDGNTIWNRNHQVMATALNPNYNSSSQSSLIIRQPGSANLYHLFTTPAFGAGLGRHFVIDMSLQAGMGGVSKSDTVFTPTQVAEKLTAVIAANGTDYWVLFRRVGYFINGFLSYALTQNGVDPVPVISSVGDTIDNGTGGYSSLGCMKVSPTFNRLACANATQDIELFDFNNATGIVTHPYTLSLDTLHSCYGLEFSASGNYLYANYNLYPPDDSLVRFDLTSPNIWASKEFVGACPECLFGQMNLAPDGKIYIAQYNRKCLATISKPDGPDPRFADSALTLPNLDYLGLPNFPRVQTKPQVLRATTLISSDYACLGGTISYIITSTLGNDLHASVTFEDGSTQLLRSSDSVIRFTRNIRVKKNYYLKAVVWSGNDSLHAERDVVSAQTNAFYDCCTNVVRNGNFYEIATGGQCFTTEYETDMDFRASTTSACPYVISTPGQIASNSDVTFGNVSWEGSTHSKPGDFLLYGEPVPNLPQRAWIQKVPVWKNRTYHYQAFVKNIEKTARFDTSGCVLSFALILKQNNKYDTLARRAVRYTDGWLPLDADYVSLSDDEVELAIVVLSSSIGPRLNSFGFAIDDISFSAKQYLVLHAGSDTSICVGSAVQLHASAFGAASQRWSPSIGLSNDSVLQPLASPAVTTLYHIIAYDSSGCEAHDSVRITVGVAQPIRLIAQKTILCEGDTTLLSIQNLYSNVRWSDGSTGTSIVVKKSGAYYAQAVDQYGCTVHSDTVTLSYSTPISATVSLPDSTASHAGKVFSIPIVLHLDSDVLKGSVVRFHLRCRSDVLVLTDTTIHSSTVGDWRVFEVDASIASTDTVAYITFLALLAPERMSDLIIDSIDFQYNCSVVATKRQGKVYVQSCWAPGGITSSDGALNMLLLYPNPADETVVASFSSEVDEDVIVQIYNLIGVLEQSQGITHTKPTNSVFIDLTKVSSGVHRIVVRRGFEQTSGLVVKRP